MFLVSPNAADEIDSAIIFENSNDSFSEEDNDDEFYTSPQNLHDYSTCAE
jgi:hypothetical protein